jgi:hypothetical protein
MSTLKTVGLIVLTVLLFSGFVYGYARFGDVLSRPMDAQIADDMLAIRQPATRATREALGFLGDKRFEAREWLRNNPSRSNAPFAGNRFRKPEAIAFVNTLYDLGATSVHVTNVMSEAWRIKQEGGPYADTLIVTLPADVKKRTLLFGIAATEAQREHLDIEVDSGQDELTFWWD